MSMDHFKTELVHISELRQGDIVAINGETYTVGRKDIKNDFMGWQYRGDPHFQTKGMLDRFIYPFILKEETISLSS